LIKTDIRSDLPSERNKDQTAAPGGLRRAFTFAQFIDEVDAYIRWYNETRIKMSLGGRSPIEYRKSLGLMP